MSNFGHRTDMGCPLADANEAGAHPGAALVRCRSHAADLQRSGVPLLE